MERIGNLAQNYSQAPWRRQLQIIGLFSLILVFIALVAGIYLNISARAAAVGREIQGMQSSIETLDREIEDAQSRLAIIMSSSEMEARARNLGFEPVDTEQVMYLVVQGYVERQPVIMAPVTTRQVVSAPIIPAEYTESLFSWLKRKSARLSFLITEVP
jgi:hypothetical protein